MVSGWDVPKTRKVAMGFNPVQKMCQDQALFHGIRIWERQRYGDFTRQKTCRYMRMQRKTHPIRKTGLKTMFLLDMMILWASVRWEKMRGCNFGRYWRPTPRNLSWHAQSWYFNMFRFHHNFTCFIMFVCFGTHPNCQTLKWRVLTSCFQWTLPSFFQGWKAPVREVDPAKGAVTGSVFLRPR